MTLLRLEDVSVRFGERAVVDAVDLEVAEHEIVCVLGPSGSGKSTLLRVVAGLQQVSGGRVLLGGADQAGVPVHRRGVGLMFQDHQLFPHRDVGGNVAFGLRMRGAGRGAYEAQVAELLELVGLPGAQGRAVASLSGGEQQRVALARALAPSPRLLMLDEPLGQLDRGLRERLVVELQGLFSRLGTTVLAVTHDQGEAFALADRVVVMRDGRIAQAGTPLEVWRRPASEFVARFLGFENVVPTVVSGGAADTPWGKVPVPAGSPEGEQRLLVRPAGVVLGEGLACVVEARTFRGTHVALLLRPEAGPVLEAECGLAGAPSVGDRVAVSFTPSEVVVLPAG
ncbi:MULTISPECIES: ABC transporter ATP-binding protein [unclassified Streptomyces]|uniref:ABC transporter ATP-binding protein n=1 Tax=unclassified Streptomyces TaxID=2593676 RepID=UPI001BEB39C0|nr:MULTISPECIES: ABC transporter ATP-binding protein [unclassified Streptomyces]MBT2406042.1 ABC transporter ATP-binding protein [Streptomyces sp. ISL-21]MBT2453553.1 ABC transporter ATP-binding protein [Streptomyces sp. ISL-86]MBT2610644.1 ABC transporter ATP-binding protein [Streptomyces sp. ISL-87]